MPSSGPGRDGHRHDEQGDHGPEQGGSGPGRLHNLSQSVANAEADTEGDERPAKEPGQIRGRHPSSGQMPSEVRTHERDQPGDPDDGETSAGQRAEVVGVPPPQLADEAQQGDAERHEGRPKEERQTGGTGGDGGTGRSGSGSPSGRFASRGDRRHATAASGRRSGPGAAAACASPRAPRRSGRCRTGCGRRTRCRCGRPRARTCLP